AGGRCARTARRPARRRRRALPRPARRRPRRPAPPARDGAGRDLRTIAGGAGGEVPGDQARRDAVTPRNPRTLSFRAQREISRQPAKSSPGSRQSGSADATSASFLPRRQALICFSRAKAANTSEVSSKYTSQWTLYLAPKPGTVLLRC